MKTIIIVLISLISLPLLCIVVLWVGMWLTLLVAIIADTIKALFDR